MLAGGGTGGDEPRYHLDSDHSSQHEEKPEDLVKRMLACPASSGMGSTRQWSGTGGSRGGHFLLLHQQSSSGGTVGGGEASNTSEDGTSLYFGGQSSVEDTTTTSDSLNADLEVCGILGTTTEDDDEGKTNIQEDSSNSVSVKNQCDFLHSVKDICKNNSEKSRSCGNVASSTSAVSNKSVTGISLLEAHRKAFKASGGKGTANSSGANLRIRICKSPNPGSAGSDTVSRQLETDSSNEYESETGIPKSPTLFISGVSISRTPEPRSPALAVANVAASGSGGRQSRSSSLTVPPPPPLNAVSATSTLGSSSISLNAGLLPGTSPEPQRIPTPVSVTPPPPPLLPPPGSPAGSCHTRSGAPSPILTASNGNASNSNIPSGTSAPTKSKSASEPEREREMFRFPKSSTDGALSSVLHVQESNLSSDDFHEALFLLERSPKGSGSKRRKKSKKDRNKDKENNGGSGIVSSTSAKGKEVKEASSAL